LLASARRVVDQGGTVLAVTAAQRFSLLGIVSVGALLASGMVSAWTFVGSVPSLLETSYGRLLSVKLLLFAAMLSVAAANRFRLVPRLAEVATIRQLQRNSLVEAITGLAVVAVVASLGALPPPVHMHMPHVH
jgi:putative copper resistance protein D